MCKLKKETAFPLNESPTDLLMNALAHGESWSSDLESIVRQSVQNYVFFYIICSTFLVIDFTVSFPSQTLDILPKNFKLLHLQLK